MPESTPRLPPCPKSSRRGTSPGPAQAQLQQSLVRASARPRFPRGQLRCCFQVLLASFLGYKCSYRDFLHLKQSNLTFQVCARAYSLLLPGREGSAWLFSHGPLPTTRGRQETTVPVPRLGVLPTLLGPQCFCQPWYLELVSQISHYRPSHPTAGLPLPLCPFAFPKATKQDPPTLPAPYQGCKDHCKDLLCHSDCPYPHQATGSRCGCAVRCPSSTVTRSDCRFHAPRVPLPSPSHPERSELGQPW